MSLFNFIKKAWNEQCCEHEWSIELNSVVHHAIEGEKFSWKKCRKCNKYEKYEWFI